MNLEKYNIIKNKFISSYREKILGLRNYYESKAFDISIKEFNMLNKKYRDYIIEMINELGCIFKNFYNIDFCIILSGSLARNSNNLFSDIDINYLTTSHNYQDIIDIEDKINYILQEVLKFRGKDKLHSMVVYLPLIGEKKISAIDNNEYVLNFIDGKIKVKCRENAEQLMYETYNSTRSIYDVINYFNKYDNEFNINEWTYCFEFIFNEKYLKIYKDYRNEYRGNDNINIFIDNLLNDIESDNIYLNEDLAYIENALLKKIYKTTVLFNFYKLLAIFYRLDKNVIKFNIDCFFYESNILDKNLFNLFNEYLKSIQDLQLILDKKNIDLSSHSNAIFDIHSINESYKVLTNRENILKDLNTKKKNLYDKCILILRRF